MFTKINQRALNPLDPPTDGNDAATKTYADGLIDSTTTATITTLKALDPTSFAVGDLVTVLGFDAIGDGGGGTFQLYNSTLSTTLDGVLMNSDTAGWHWRRFGFTNEKIDVTWAGIFPNQSSSAAFDPDGFGSNNVTRWNNVAAYCEQITGQWIDGSTAAPTVTAGMYVPGGYYDFGVGVLNLPEGVVLQGDGPLISIMRNNDVVGLEFIRCEASASFGACTQIEKMGFRAFTAQTGTRYGLRFINIVRGLQLRDVAVYNFGRNIRTEECWEFEFINVWAENAWQQNLSTFGNINNFSASGCRFDGIRDTTSAGMVIIQDNANAAQNITFSDCAFQRSETLAIKLVGVRSFVIDQGCQFEGNNRQDNSSPDIWVECSAITMGRITDNYFTTTGRNGATTSRAINVRTGVPASSVFIVEGNLCLDNSFGTFIDIDANVAMQLRWLNMNYFGTNTNSIPGNVVQT